jgi:type I restriction enzyme S subunit
LVLALRRWIYSDSITHVSKRRVFFIFYWQTLCLNGQIASTGFCVVRADKLKASSDFLYYLLLTEQVNLRIKDLQRGSSYPSVSDKEVVGQLIPLPPLPEQHTIAAVLAKIQKAIAAQQEIIDRTRELKKALMVKLFTEGLKGEATKETEIGVVPESWEVKP